MLTIKREIRGNGYSKSLMRQYLTRDRLDSLRTVMHLPRLVTDGKLVLLWLVEQNPYLKCSEPMNVLQKIREYAQSVLTREGAPLDLRVDEIPDSQERLILYSDPADDSRSVSSAFEERRMPSRPPSRARNPIQPVALSSSDDEEIKALKKQVADLKKRKKLEALQAELKELQEEE